jgi:hypothetical protein
LFISQCTASRTTVKKGKACDLWACLVMMLASATLM